MTGIKFLTAFVFVGTFLALNSAYAYSEGRDGDRIRNPNTAFAQKKVNAKLNEAKKMRYRNYFQNKNRKPYQQNVRYQKAIHQQNRSSNNISTRSTRMKRNGRYGSLPSYNYQRPSRNIAYERRNSKQTFRARAIDYYIHDGEAGTPALKSGVSFDSEHNVERIPLQRTKRKQVGSIISAVRNAQKKLSSWHRSPSSAPRKKSRQRFSFERFGHPFMPVEKE